MSTRSVIAKPTEDGWKGRYCHWDGYPEGMIPELSRLISEKGYERAVNVLINWNAGWSNLTPEPSLGRGYNDGRFKVVSNYGVAYTIGTQSSWDDWILSDEDPGWCEYAYVLQPNGTIDVWTANVDKWKWAATYSVIEPANA